MALTSAFLGIMALVPSVELLFVAYTAMGAACGVLNACFGAIAILRIPESGRGQAMAIIGGLTRAVSIGALALGGLLGALLPIRVSFLRRRGGRGPGGPGRRRVRPAPLRQRGRGRSGGPGGRGRRRRRQPRAVRR